MSDREIILEGYTRVSDILEPFSGYGSVPEHILKKAANRGTRVHQIAEAYVKGIMPLEDSELKGYVDSFLEWRGDKKIIMPNRFYDKVLRITGKIDGLYQDMTTGDYTLIDFKTSAKEGKMWALQGAAYLYLAEIVGCYPVTRIEFIRLPKDGKKAEIYDYSASSGENFSQFKEMVKMYHQFFSKKENVEWEYI
jgi:hypothetical protein